jgi:hypothetical protein
MGTLIRGLSKRSSDAAIFRSHRNTRLSASPERDSDELCNNLLETPEPLEAAQAGFEDHVRAHVC